MDRQRLDMTEDQGLRRGSIIYHRAVVNFLLRGMNRGERIGEALIRSRTETLEEDSIETSACAP